MNGRGNTLPTEEEIEEEANSHTFIMKYFRIARCEYTRFLIFGLMFGIISFIYSFMRILKDTYVMVRQDPNCILYLKIFYILPLSFAVVMLINYMLSYRTLSRIFSIFCIAFMALFFSFGIIILFEDQILFDPSTIANQFDLYKFDSRGLGFLKYFLLTINQPLATIIYVAAELWGSLMLSYFFLSFLNEACTRKQHGRFIPPLFIIANLSLLLSAITTTLFFKVRAKLSFEQNILLMAAIFFLEGGLTLALLSLKYILEKRVMAEPLFSKSITPALEASAAAGVDEPMKKKDKTSIGFAEGLGIMSQSRFLLAMSTIVFFFSVLANILETVYKNGINRGAQLLNKEKGAYSGWYNNLDQYITSISVIVLNLSSFSNLISTTSWFTVAIISPIIASVSSACILGIAIYNTGTEESTFKWLNKMFGGAANAIRLENYVGMLCLSAMKIFKFAAFDVSKEKISMRIADKYRPKFKSVFDGIFNKFGKSFGAFYGIGISMLFTDIDLRGMAPVTAIFAFPFIGCWIAAVFYLSRSYEKALVTKGNVDIDLADESETNEQLEREKLEANRKDGLIQDNHKISAK